MGKQWKQWLTLFFGAPKSLQMVTVAMKLKEHAGDFPDGSVVNILPPNVEGTGSIPGQGAKIPHALRPKNQNISSIVTNSIKTLKMVHIKKKKVLKIKPQVQTHTFTLANLKFSWKISFYETRQDLMF